MTKSRIILTSFVCLLFVLAGCAKSAITPTAQRAETQSKPPEAKRIVSTNVIRAETNPTQISVGSFGEVIVRLTIEPGYHINANPPTYSYLKATELEIAEADGVSVNSVYYPPPLSKKLAFAEKPVAVYEGTTELKVTLEADRSAKKGGRSISAKLHVQACDEQVCYPPGTLDLTIPVSIR
ncbi:MAG: hypothetical protein M3Y84_15400 [Acidobacteriota bacterium]|nr:hypothetical protein [Acidobacteriota bacterium]